MMARHGDVTLGWADGEYRFRLPWGGLIAVQEACDAGPAHVLERLVTGRWMVQDIREVLFQGLLGGGMDAAPARKLIARYVEQAPLNENVIVAQAVLMAALAGVDDDPVDLPPGKPEADLPTQEAG